MQSFRVAIFIVMSIENLHIDKNADNLVQSDFN